MAKLKSTHRMERKHERSLTTAYVNLDEGDYFFYTDKDGIKSAWMYDRGYLCCLSKNGLRIYFSDRHMRYGTPHTRQLVLPPEFDPYRTVGDLIKEVEYRIATGLEESYYEARRRKRLQAKASKETTDERA